MLQELLWGYEDPLLAKLSWVKPNLPTRFRLIQNATSAAEALEGTSTVVNTGDSFQYLLASYQLPQLVQSSCCRCHRQAPAQSAAAAGRLGTGDRSSGHAPLHI